MPIPTRSDRLPNNVRTHRRLAVTLVAALASACVTGCEDVQVNWGNQQQQPSRRTNAPPAGRVVQQSAGQPPAAAARPAAQPVADAPRPAPADQPKPTLSLYQLVLLSEAGPAEAPPGMKNIRLQRAKARDVGNLLCVLYLPSGPSGTEDRFTLVYPTPLEHELAADAALLLDVPRAAGPMPEADTASQFEWGVGEAFVIADDRAAERSRIRMLADALARLVPSTQLSRDQRWIAGMLAGDLLANRLYEYAAADAVYRQAEAAAEPGSYPQMIAMHARALAYVQDGRRDEGRKLLETILAQFSSMRGCEVFERSRETLAQWDRRR